MALLFDSHAHYNDERFRTETDCGGLIGDIFAQGEVGWILNAGTNIVTSEESVALAEKYPGRFFASAGIHPHDICDIKDDISTLEKLKKLLSHPKAVAVGEIGLDYHYDIEWKETQIKWFRYQMQLARELDMPVIIHDREAHGDTLDIIREYPSVRGILHSYSGSREMAAELVRRGWYISFTGVITFKNASRVLEVVKSIPPERILVETDCPYLVPHPFRGKLNHSGYLKYTAAAAAEARQEDYDRFCEKTAANTFDIYGINI